MAHISCLRCEGEMQKGFLLDHSDAMHYAGQWVKGPAVKSEWNFGTVKVPAESFEITTYRCVVCGYLESYAKSATKHV